MNIFSFLITKTLVENRTGNSQRASLLGFLASYIPGNQGLLMGILLANNEQAPITTPPASSSSSVPAKTTR